MWTEAYQHLLSLISFSRNSVVDQRRLTIRSQQKRIQQQDTSIVRFVRLEWAMEVEKTENYHRVLAIAEDDAMKRCECASISK